MSHFGATFLSWTQSVLCAAHLWFSLVGSESLISWLFLWCIVRAKCYFHWIFLLLFFFVAEVNLVGGAGTFIFQLRNWKGQAPQWPARQQALLSTLLRHLFFKPVQHRVFVLFDPLDVDSGLLYGLFHCPGSRTQVVVSLKTFQLYTHTHTHTKWD